jgi:PhnB protein
MHSILSNGGIKLMASDMMDKDKLNRGNNFALILDCSNEAEIKDLFTKLSQGGKVGHPLKVEFWGDTFGDLTDKFGIRWMLNLAKENI